SLKHRARISPLTSALPSAPGHPFYEKFHEMLKRHGFTQFVEDECRQYYDEVFGRPSVPPTVYFKMLFVGFFEGIDSERGIAWRVADSMGLRQFLGYELTEDTPDHSSVSRTRRLMSVETHRLVFQWALGVLAKEKVLKGKTLGIDATTLEANAALRSIVRRDTGESYEEFLTRLAKASGIETPTRADLVKLDKKRKGKASNKDWEHPFDPDARIAKMKDGSTHMAHKAEHAVDMESGAVLAVTLQCADQGDTETLPETLRETAVNLAALERNDEAAPELDENPMSKAVLDKGYHSNETLMLLDFIGARAYVSEPDRGRRDWKGDDKEYARQCVYGNRRRIRGDYGKALMRQRGEKVERSFAHVYETGAMRRTHLRHHGNILKRLLIHVGGFNLSLVLRKQTGFGKPRTLQDAYREGRAALLTLFRPLWNAVERISNNTDTTQPIRRAEQLFAKAA
ncbi:MAG: transposase, partial [Candidatus Hydrogenedentota bacterium]